MLLVCLSTMSPSLKAQSFIMPCDIQGVIPALEDKAVAPARVNVEIRTIGNNIFILLKGPAPYEMKLSTLTTNNNIGTNLTNPKFLGVRMKSKDTGREAEIKIDQKSVTLKGYNDIDYMGKFVRLVMSGPCTLPK